MAILTIKDLDQNDDLDREAMKQISGGAGSPWQKNESQPRSPYLEQNTPSSLWDWMTPPTN